jgi:hypothetical protein
MRLYVNCQGSSRAAHGAYIGESSVLLHWLKLELEVVTYVNDLLDNHISYIGESLVLF